MMFDTIEYEISTGKKPKGRGMWAFSTRRHPEPEEIKFFYGTLTEAKKQAKAAFKGEIRIYVLP